MMTLKLAICIPIRERMLSRFAIGLLGLPAHLRTRGFEPVFYFDNTPFYESRNNLAKTARASTPDYYLWLDDDMQFVPAEVADFVKQAVEDKRDIATGIYFKRRFPDYGATIFKQEGNSMNEVLSWPDEVFEVDRCGFGCVVVSAKAMDTMYDKLSGNLFNFTGIMGEDFYFCLRAKQYGFSIWAYPSLKLGHDGITFWHFEKYRNDRIAEMGLELVKDAMLTAQKKVDK